MKPEVVDGVMVRKSLTIKASDATIAENHINGAAAALGNLDRGGDVLFPGVNCFSDALPGFLSAGFVAVGHDWYGLPVAMPIKAEERGRQLYTEAVFHSTQEAQAARTVAMERKEHGLAVGLSIGFGMSRSGYNWFENGEEMLSFASDTLKLDMSLFDVDTIAKYADYCRGIWKVRELYEYSIVPVPMNPEAVATDAKSLRGIETIRDFEACLRSRLGFSKSQATALASGGWSALRRDAGGQENGDNDGRDARQKSAADTAAEAQQERTRSLRLQHRLRSLKV